ncbi:MAG: glutamine--fructose-6-phosphate transaminase (isomerizing) [Thermodesulfobacteriota bacterium]
MCGIVGYSGTKPAAEVLVEGLRRLEYRGYDSSGLALLDNGNIELVRSVGKLQGLVKAVAGRTLNGQTGVGHTRWATHGKPTEANAHPHKEGSVAVVHNGIIENYLALKKELVAGGAVFRSETDTEVLAHLISREVEHGLDLASAVREAVGNVKGTYALAAISEKEPGTVVGARMECPMIVGLGQGEAIISSDIPAVLDVTREAVFLEDKELVVLRDGEVEISDFSGKKLEKKPVHIDWSPVMAEKGGYRHFMLKEIFEQPRAITDTFRGNISEETGEVFLEGLEVDVTKLRRIYILACGTSWHAALVGKFLLEKYAAIPVEVDLASEFRYRDPLVGESDLVIAISQSGETADTIAAVREAKKKGSTVLSICNVMESSLTREAAWSFMTHAGPEIGVASTKAFTTQLTALMLIAINFGRNTGRLGAEEAVALLQEFVRLPGKIEKVLDREPEIEAIARECFHYRDFIFIGRGINYPIALEGALKLKEISYIHAEGYPAGEMKHGPIALIDEDMPVVALAPADASMPKMLGNMEEVRARGGRIIAIVTEGETSAAGTADHAFTVPAIAEALEPILLSIPLQLLAYHVAVLKGTDVDQPRNLAKSVTVE